MTRPGRLRVFEIVADLLAQLDVRQLLELLGQSTRLGTGIGGRSSVLDVSGVRVFVKRVPLTDLERLPANWQSTANLFGLPLVCHYGIGSPGFGAWRELAVHEMTTEWVVQGRHHAFPLMYHWRVVPDTPPEMVEEVLDVERAVNFWGGSEAFRRRLDALRSASASLLIFMEYVPDTLTRWLNVQAKTGADAFSHAVSLIDQELRSGTAFMRANRVVHFDAHFDNILTDGHQIFFADFGLALSTQFALAPDEADFLTRHKDFDHCDVLTRLAWHLVAVANPRTGLDSLAVLADCADGVPPPGLPPPVADVLRTYAPLAVEMIEWFRALQTVSREVPYPADRLTSLIPRTS